jgi:hypothetical protein
MAANTQVVSFAEAAVPSYFAGTSPEESNISPEESIPALSFRGKVWRLAKDGEEITIMNKDQEPSSMVSVVILDYIKPRSRVFYEGVYVAGENKAPNCSSLDGKTPDADIATPVSKFCATCPHAVKGSKITPAGKATTACGMTKRIAIVPVSQPDSIPYLLRLAPTSIWDKDNKEGEAAGWYAWDQYTAMLAGKGCTNTAQVVTKMKFDHRAEYPKLLFSASRWLTPEEWAVMQVKWKAPEVKELLYGKTAASVAESEAAPDGDEGDGLVVAGTPAAAAAAHTAAAAPAPAPTRKPRAAAAQTPAQTPAQVAAAAWAVAAANAQAAAAAAAVEAANAASTIVEEDDGGEGDMGAAASTPAAAAKTTPPAAAAPAAPATANAGLSSLLAGWDD